MIGNNQSVRQDFLRIEKFENGYEYLFASSGEIEEKKSLPDNNPTKARKYFPYKVL